LVRSILFYLGLATNNAFSNSIKTTIYTGGVCLCWGTKGYMEIENTLCHFSLGFPSVSLLHSFCIPSSPRSSNILRHFSFRYIAINGI
jgi:hypothetical protein